MPTPAKLTTAVSDMEAAYTSTATLANPDFLNFNGGILGNETLASGLYKWSSAVTITDSLTMDGGGDVNAVWIFQIDNRLNFGTGSEILLSNGARSENIFWQTAEGVTLGTNSHFEGIVLTATDVAFQSGATMNGRLFAQTSVTLESNNIAAPVPEPSTYAAIMGLSVIGLLLIRRPSSMRGSFKSV
ncbi:MAG: ice-binding family protein [Opitutales bacterium]